MLAGTTKVDITPDIGVPIGGNVREDNISRGIHDQLYANILYLESEGKELLLVGCDLIGIDKKVAEAIKTRIEEELGISKNNIILFATHTHSGPDILGSFKDKIDPKIEAYLNNLIKKIVLGAKGCKNHPWKAKVGLGKSYEASLSFNRRIFLKDGSLQMNWESIAVDEIDKAAGPIDPDLFYLCVKDEQGKIRSIVVNFTLHPAVLVGKDWLFSRDFIDRLTEDLEAHLHENLVVLFANGAEGNINHINIHDFMQGRGFEETDRIGGKLAKNILEDLQSLKYFKLSELSTESVLIKLPRRKLTKKQIEEAKNLIEASSGNIPSMLDGVPDEVYAKEILEMEKYTKDYLETELQITSLGEDIAIVCLPGEFFVEHGLEIKQSSPFSKTMIFGLANDCIGYVPTEAAFHQGGYEIKTARTSQLAPNAGRLVVEKVIYLLEKLKGGVASQN